MYWVMFGCVGFTVFFTYVMQRREGDDYQKPKSLMEELWSKKDVELPGGQLIHFSSRTDYNVSQIIPPHDLMLSPSCCVQADQGRKGMWHNPNKPYGGDAAYRESWMWQNGRTKPPPREFPLD